MNYKYPLEETTLAFSIELISKLKSLPRDMFNIKLIDQLIRSGTSIGANYVEANGAESKKDFIHKLRIAYKEARETRYWLTVLSAINAKAKIELENLLRESDEYVKMFSKIISSAAKSSKI